MHNAHITNLVVFVNVTIIPFYSLVWGLLRFSPIKTLLIFAFGYLQIETVMSYQISLLPDIYQHNTKSYAII